jgi:hypothetical protein
VEKDSYEFAEEIRKELDKGFGFVPLIGSGLSVASGIPTSQQVEDYLLRCLYLALEGKWNPRQGRWPELYSGESSEGLYEWIENKIKTLGDMYKRGQGVSKAERLCWEAIGSLANWRTTLQFLSRLDIARKEFVLGAPDYNVIDSFFFTLQEGITLMWVI